MLWWSILFCILTSVKSFATFPRRNPKSHRGIFYSPKRIIETGSKSIKARFEKRNSVYDDTRNSELTQPIYSSDMGGWEGNMEGFDWQLEQARRILEGPSFDPIRMTLWQPILNDYRQQSEKKPPGFYDFTKILINNAFQIMGLADSMDGAPLVQGVNTFKGSPLKFLSRVLDGNLQELAGGPLFLLLHDYYKRYGPIYKLAFGPKSFIVVSDPVMVKHILKDNPMNYDKGILAVILEPIMGKGLIPADPETWKVRRRAIVPGFHKAWLNGMVRDRNYFGACDALVLRT
jgi:hypothetical protein